MSTEEKSTSKKKDIHNEFNPNLAPKDYLRANIQQLIATAGQNVLDDYNNGHIRLQDQLKNEYYRENGLDPDQYSSFTPNQLANLTGVDAQDYNAYLEQKKKLNSIVSKTKRYQDPLSQYRFDYANRLYQDGLLGTLANLTVSQAATMKVGKELSKSEVDVTFGRLGRDEFLIWLVRQDPHGFKTNALEQAGVNLGIRGVKGIKTKGFEKKEDIYNLIMTKTGNSTKGGIRSAPSTSGSVSMGSMKDRLAELGVNSAGELNILVVQQLKDLATRYGLSVRGKKADYIDAITKAAGFESLPSTTVTNATIDRLIALAKTNPLAARESARSLVPNEISPPRVSLEKLKQLATAVSLSKEYPVKTSSPSAELIIRTLTGQGTAKSRSLKANSNIRTDMNACNNATMDSIVREAEKNKIPIIGLSKTQICEKIYGHYLSRLSELILKRNVDLRKIATLSPSEQDAEVKKIARVIKLDGVTTLSGLIKKWLEAHYIGRALNTYPKRKADVEAYLATGLLPTDPNALRELAIIFSDVEGGTYNMNDEQKREALTSLYTYLIRRIELSTPSGISAFIANLDRFGFASRDEGSPLRMVTSPTRASSPPRSVVRATTPVRSLSREMVPVVRARTPTPATSSSRYTSPVSSPRARALSPVRYTTPSRELDEFSSEYGFDENVEEADI